MAVLVTGASSGFGAAICRTLVREGYQVVGAARRFERLQELQDELGGLFYPLKMDLADKDSVSEALETLPEEFARIDCLVNNGGLALGLDSADKADFADWETMIQTNIVGLAFLTHKLLPAMTERRSGYVINIGSIAGTYPYPGGNVYGASKAFVRQFSLNLRADLHGTGVRVTNIEPGLCGGTEFSEVRFKGDGERAAKLYENTQYIEPQDIADTVLWLYRRPAHMNVNTIEIMPTAQSFGALPVYREAVSQEVKPFERQSVSLFRKIRNWFG